MTKFFFNYLGKYFEAVSATIEEFPSVAFNQNQKYNSSSTTTLNNIHYTRF